jgi:outer membrane protein TolC
LLAAGLLPNPSFGAEVLDASGAGSAGLALSQAFQLSIDTSSLVTRGSRLEAARAELAQVDLGIAWQEWQVAGSARLGAVRLGWLRRRLALARAESGFLAAGVDALERARRSGDATATELGVERAALEVVRQARRELEGVESATESELLATLGRSPIGHLDVEAPRAPSEADLETPPLDGVLEGCLAHRLDLAALRHGYAAEEARLRAAVLEQLPGVTVGVAHQRNEDSIRFFGGFVELNLPVFDRSQAKIALSEATRARLSHEYEARVLSVRQEVDALLRALRTIGAQIREVRTALPDTEEFEAHARRALAHGDIERLSHQAIRTSLFDLELTLESLSQARAEGWVGLALACGQNLETAFDPAKESRS